MGAKNSKKIIINNFYILIISLIVAFGIGEMFLRYVPLKGIITARSVFDTELGYKRVNGAISRYITKTNKIVIRKTNKMGYFDKEHDREKRKYRIGFFGDSYLEAIQVPLENTFHYLSEEKLKDKNIETFAFGKPGGGTLQAFNHAKRWMKYYDLDLVVYVFYENDLGDQIIEIKRANFVPHAKLTDNGYQAYLPEMNMPSWLNPKIYIFLDRARSYSVLLTNVIARVGLLLEYGISLEKKEERKPIEKSNKSGHYPDSNDFPSTWPAQIKKDATRLGELIIKDFRYFVEINEKKFAILYIPRETEFEKELSLQDSWKPWLVSFCKSEGISLIDPTNALIKYKQTEGKEVYGDHFTEWGHLAVAEAFTIGFQIGNDLMTNTNLFLK